ncbi:MAG: GNAT family N-acetyltransferase [Gammaproteobacteria bacterium]|nr:GNAT family N-acetyltransferase [Gammaproteobacteria bacterium]MCY4358054.1 GNAT family N-acetyltransferase [Gammaproteobacteria bacterium]
MTLPDLQPTLNSPIVSVRPIQLEDWSGLFAVASDPLVWEQHPATDRYQEKEFRKFFDDALNCGSAFTFVDLNSGDLIGSSRYHGYNQSLNEIEIGWTFLGRNYWGGVHNREVKKLMLTHAFKFVDTVLFWVGTQNTRSRKAVEKIGGIQREGVYTRQHGKKEFPYVVYELKKMEFTL